MSSYKPLVVKRKAEGVSLRDVAKEEEPGIAAFEEGGQEPEHMAASGVEGSSQLAASKEAKPSVYKRWEQNLANDPNEPGSRFFPELPDKSPSADTLILDIMRLQGKEPAQSPGLLTYTILSYEFWVVQIH